MDVREVGRRLGVGRVLEASVRRSRQAPLTAQLLNVHRLPSLVGEIRPDVRDIFAIQDEITLAS